MKRFISKSQLILLFSYVIFIAHTLAEPPEEVMNSFIAHRQLQREARLSARAGLNLHAGTVTGLEKNDLANANPQANTSNWSGAVQSPSPSGTFHSVSAQWTLPSVTVPPSANGSGTWWTSQWIGIDGYSCDSAILQAGISSFVQVVSVGDVNHGAIAWYEWFPAGLYSFMDFDVNAGDMIQVSVHATNLSRGTAQVTNLSLKNSTSIKLTAPTNTSELCGRDAEWIVEDENAGGLVPFSKFSKVKFHKCMAETTTGHKVNLTDATLVNMVQGGMVLAEPVVVTDTVLEIHYA